MANLPATVVCTGCGSWFRIDVENSGGMALVGLTLVTLVLAFFWPIMLVFLPVYFVMSMGRLQRFNTELVQEPRAEIWTISRETGEIKRMSPEEEGAVLDTKLSEKFAGLSPKETNVFREKAAKYQALKARMAQQGGIGPKLKPGPLGQNGPPQLSH